MYKKIVIKLSGESLMGEDRIDFDKCLEIARDLKNIYETGIRLLIVIGGGNFWRGRENEYMDSTAADYVGMLATEMNALILGDALRSVGCPSKVFLRYNVPYALEYKKEDLVKEIDDNILIIGGGTGKPGFSTDTASSMAASDIDADLIIKLSKTDGVYDSDPFKNPNAKKYDTLTFDEAISKKLGIMDLTAFEICKENNIKIVVTKMDNILSIIDIANNKISGTLIER